MTKNKDPNSIWITPSAKKTFTTSYMFTRRTRDIERFAKIHMGIDLLPHQLTMIDAITSGKTLFLGRRAGRNTAHKVLQEFALQTDGYIKHFEKVHFTGVTKKGKKFVYCPVGNIVSWSEGDYDHKYCAYEHKMFEELKT